jgi:cysteine-S-conjugate beta-lyase
MPCDFDFLPDRRNTECAKWRQYDDDVLPMWVADMDFLSPEPVIRALRERVEHGVFGYPCEPDELRQVIIDHLSNKYHWTVTAEDVLIMPGVVNGFNLASQAIAKPGDGVLIQTPVYPPFFGAQRHACAISQQAELTRLENGAYSIDFEKFEQAITDQTRIFILCNPHNPVGRVFRQDELEKMAEICLRHGITICSDEIHCDLVFSGHQHIPMAALNPEIARNTITLMAPSKTYNIAGLSCSIAVIQNKELRHTFLKAGRGLIGGVNILGQVAALAAFKEGQPWLDELLCYLEANRDFLYEYVSQEFPGISMGLPEATYLAWLDCRQSGIQGNPHDFFLEKARVAMNKGDDFGANGQGFVRMNFGCPRPILVEALERMKKALAG